MRLTLIVTFVDVIFIVWFSMEQVELRPVPDTTKERNQQEAIHDIYIYIYIYIYCMYVC